MRQLGPVSLDPHPRVTDHAGEVTASWDESNSFLLFLSQSLPPTPTSFPAWGWYSQQPVFLSPVI